MRTFVAGASAAMRSVAPTPSRSGEGYNAHMKNCLVVLGDYVMALEPCTSWLDG